MSKCRSCKAEINFVRTEKGKLLPIDPVAVPYGNIAVTADGDPPSAHFVKPSMERNFRAHFATCPEAAKHRKVKAAEKRVAEAPVRKKRGKNEPTIAVQKAERERVAYETAMAGG